MPPADPCRRSCQLFRAITTWLDNFDPLESLQSTSVIDTDRKETRMTLKKIDHEFKNQSLSYEASPNYRPCIRLSFWFNKLPEVSDEQFHRHWETVHADLTVATKDFNVCKIQRYVQFHQAPEMKEKANSLGLEHLDFDGCSEIWVKSWDDWMRFFQVSCTRFHQRSVADRCLTSTEPGICESVGA